MTTTTEWALTVRIRSACAIAAALALCAATGQAQTVGNEESRLLDSLRQTHPGTRFSEVKRTEVAGLYEVWMDSNVAYVTAANPRYFVFGRLFDTAAMRDLTAPRLAERSAGAEGRLETVAASADGTAAVDIDQLPLVDALKTVRGRGERQIVVFSDPGCVYCRNLEPELAALDNVTIHTFLLPFQGEARPIAIWCARDRHEAWEAWMLRGDARPQQKDARCDHPIARNLALARRLGVRGTPTLFWRDGSRTDGYVDRTALAARLAATQVTSATAPAGARGRP